jgi:type IV secretory pathway TrbD component
MLRQKADETDEAKQSDEVPEQVALVGCTCSSVFGFGANSAALSRLGCGGPHGHGHEEQREYRSPGHWHPPSLVQALAQAASDLFKDGVPTSNKASTQSSTFTGVTIDVALATGTAARQVWAMLFYWIVFAAFAIGALTYQIQWAIVGSPAELAKQPLALLKLTGIALIVIVGLRYQTGGDWNNYRVAFEDIIRKDFWSAIETSGQEPGYAVLNWIAGQFDVGIWLVNLICAVPFSWGLIKLCKQQPNPWLSLLVAWPFLIIVVGMGFTRQGVAGGFLLAGIADYIERQKLDRCLLLILVGSLFHKTVLVFAPVLYLAGSRNKFVSFGLVVVAGAIAYFTFSDAANTYRAGYVNARYEAAGAQVRVLMNILPALLLLVTRNRFYRTPEERNVWRTFAWLALAAGLALPIIRSSVIVDRLGMYLIPIQMFALGRMPVVFHKDPQWRMLVIACMGAVMFTWFTYGHYSAGWVPYRTYLFG